jgi:hypothetical protein
MVDRPQHRSPSHCANEHDLLGRALALGEEHIDACSMVPSLSAQVCIESSPSRE